MTSPVGYAKRAHTALLAEAIKWRRLPIGLRFGFCSHIEAPLPKISCS